MDKPTAERITNLTVKAYMSRLGLFQFTDEDAKLLGEHDLDEWIVANRLCKEMMGHEYSGMVVETRGLAELYLRVTSRDFKTIDDIESLISAAVDLYGESPNGYGVVIDDRRQATLVKLNYSGLGGDEMATAGTYQELHEMVNNKAAEAA